MRGRLRQSAMYFVLCSLIALIGLAGCRSAPNTARAVAGTLDLRQARFDREEPVLLTGPWQFYWKRLLTLSDLATRAGYAPIDIEPGVWLGAGKGLEKAGYATYHLRVLLPERESLIALRFGEIVSASEVELDGVIVARHGRVGMDAAHASLLHRPQLIDHVVKNGVLELVVRVSNFDHDYPGLTGVSLGRSSTLHRARDFELFQVMLVLGGITLMMLYHLGLYSLRPGDRSTLYLACLCASVAAFTFLTASDLPFEVFPQLSGEGWWKSYYLSWLSGVTSLLYFLHSLVPDEFAARALRPSLLFSLGCGLFVLLTPMRVYDPLLAPAYQAFSVAAVLYSSWALARGLGKKRDGAGILLTGLFALFALFLHDILVAEQIVMGPYLSALGLSLFLLAQSLLLARKFTRAFFQVEASERVRTEFFRNTSHELRTPLHGILGFVELLRRGHYGALESGARVALDKVVQLAEGLRSQVDTILDLAKSRQGKLELSCTRMSLNEVAHELSALADGLCLSSPLLTFVRELSWDPDGESPSFAGDRDKLLTVVRNLLGNAFKFRELDKPHRVTLRMRREESRLSLEVEDTGIGIPLDQQDRVFEEFVQVAGHDRRGYEGTGLGLSLVKRCVLLMGGAISLHSRPGEGTRFVIDLPEQASVLLRERTSQDESRMLPRSSATEAVSEALSPALEEAAEIMVVDDQPQNLEVMRELLHGAGYAVVSCGSGREALAWLQGNRPDVILLDLMMPEVSGEDVLRTLRADARLADVPVVLLTARASREDRLAGLRLGADDYLAKPVDSAELLLRVRNTLARSALAREKLSNERNLEAARAVQEALLPVQRDFPCVVLEDHYQAAEQVGGDWFAYGHDERHQRLYVALGDVTGHGMPAALMTGAAVGAFRARLAELKSLDSLPSDAQQSLVRAVHEGLRDASTRTGHGMTMILIELELATGTGFVVNAGHEPPFLLRSAEAEPLSARGSILGAMEPGPFAREAFALQPGEGVFLYTDGLLSNRGKTERALSPRRLQKLLAHADQTALKQRLISTIQGLWGDAALEDDCSFIVLRWQPGRPISRSAT
jgi:signal transduction histidine kinase/serine phosphatase RsbU (regulator of sigma subunit)